MTLDHILEVLSLVLVDNSAALVQLLPCRCSGNTNTVTGEGLFQYKFYNHEYNLCPSFSNAVSNQTMDIHIQWHEMKKPKTWRDVSEVPRHRITVVSMVAWIPNPSTGEAKIWRLPGLAVELNCEVWVQREI